MIRSLFISRGFSRHILHNTFNLRATLVRSIMVGNNEVLERVEKRATEAEEMVDLLKEHIDCLQRAVDKRQSPGSQTKIESLRKENQRLKEEGAKLKKELVHWEVRNGVKQVALPLGGDNASKKPLPASSNAASIGAPAHKTQPEKKPAQEGEEKKAGKKPKAEKTPKQAKKEEARLDASRFDFRIGKINSIKRHPDADTLFVEEIDVGEETHRTICTGVVGHIPMEALQGALVVIMANLKPVKMRGISSQGMVMCAKTEGKWSALVPPKGVVPGDRVVFDAYPGTPDAQLNPKKKVWEQCAPDFKTDAEGIPNFKGDRFNIPGKGFCTTDGVKNGIIR